jgi:dihydroflavonol-4-reductase
MQSAQRDDLVLVTGGSGFIAVHCILQLLQAGHRVRTTVRSPDRQAVVRAMLSEGGVEAGDRLSFAFTELTSDAGWADAAMGCVFVMHGASPTPSGPQTREEDWIGPARDGVLRVLRAARDAGVRRVVLTSAFGAVGYGQKPRGRPFNETDWTDLDGDVPAYQKSKTLSERAAWDFIGKEGQGLELSTVNPVAVMGPILGPDFSHSIRLAERMLLGRPGCPDIRACFVDVRDVADLHVRAMTDPAARGERFLATSGPALSLLDVSKILRANLGEAARKAPTRLTPNWVIRMGALFGDPNMKMLAPQLGISMSATGEKAKRLLGWSPRSPEEAIIATGQSLLRLDPKFAGR